MNTLYPPVRQQPIFTNNSNYMQVPPSIVPSTQLPNQFMDNGSVMQSNTTMNNALVQPVTNTCISASNQQQNDVPTTSMTNETLYDFLNTTGTCSSSMLNFSKPSIAKPLALGVDPKIGWEVLRIIHTETICLCSIYTILWRVVLPIFDSCHIFYTYCLVV